MKPNSASVMLLIVPLVFYVDKNATTFNFTLNYNNHTEVLQYLWEVRNFPILNPTIFSIQTLYRSPEELHIKYEECLSQFRMVTNVGFARYNIQKKDDDTHDIISTHLTCFLGEYFCLPTNSRVRLRGRKSEVLYEEAIEYNCPWIFKPFCFQEILFQRMMIMNNLKEMFSDCVA